MYDHFPDGADVMVLSLREQVPELVTARRWAARRLADLTDAELGDVLLVATELVTNAYDHGAPPREIRMMRLIEPCAVRIEVDDSSSQLPVKSQSVIGRPRGRGLVIVDKLAEDWGVIPNVVGKTVWAEVSCSASP